LSRRAKISNNEPFLKPGWFWEWLWKKRQNARFFPKSRVAFPKLALLGKLLFSENFSCIS
jgi:hypothetical protein